MASTRRKPISGIASSGPTAASRQHRRSVAQLRELAHRADDHLARGPRQRADDPGQILNRDAQDLQRHDVGAGADGHGRVDPFASQLAGDLARGVAGADDQHALAAHFLRSAVGDAVTHLAAEVVEAGDLRDARIRDDPAGHHDRIRGQRLDVRVHTRAHAPMSVLALERRHLGAALDRQRKPAAILVQILEKPIARNEQRRPARKAHPRQMRHVLPGVQRQRVIEPRPALRHLAALEHDMLDAAPLQLAGSGQAGGARADDDGGRECRIEN